MPPDYALLTETLRRFVNHFKTLKDEQGTSPSWLPARLLIESAEALDLAALAQIDEARSRSDACFAPLRDPLGMSPAGTRGMDLRSGRIPTEEIPEFSRYLNECLESFLSFLSAAGGLKKYVQP